MFTTLRKFTVILLAILQLFAPLVHAHAGETASGLGLHVPGLEIYAVKQDTSVQATGYDARLATRAITTVPSAEGVIVNVDAGMKDTQANATSNLDGGLYLHQQAQPFNTTISPFDINFSPQTQPFVCRLFIPSLSPRAPPTQ